ncbi:MAG: 4-(cytidine 5'-diphospho)-2-C-methyl-D-erythritol kinase [Parvibaculum sp.]
MSAILETANAKINLSLKVLGKRADGYHLLESLVVFADIADRLTCREADHLSLELSGPFASALGSDGSSNLVLEAAKSFAAEMGRQPDLAFTLEKNLPVASGIGGGSADAAAAIRTMVRLWGDPDCTLQSLALSLGADVPVCLRKKPSIMSGIGEQLTPLRSLPDMDAVLVNPGVRVSTGAVFKTLRAEPISQPEAMSSVLTTNAPAFTDKEGVLTYLAANGNDLETPARKLEPQIDKVLERIAETPGCRLARMSGSGATCFGLYDNPFDAAEAASVLKKAAPDWWVVATIFKGV